MSGAGEVYDKLVTVCNSEMSKAVNGNTLTTEVGDKGTQALGVVQQEGEEDITIFIKRKILNILNYEVTDVRATQKEGSREAGGGDLPPEERGRTAH